MKTEKKHSLSISSTLTADLFCRNDTACWVKNHFFSHKLNQKSVISALYLIRAVNIWWTFHTFTINYLWSSHLFKSRYTLCIMLVSCFRKGLLSKLFGWQCNSYSISTGKKKNSKGRTIMAKTHRVKRCGLMPKLHIAARIGDLKFALIFWFKTGH